MSKGNEFPKMLYRDNQITGTMPIHGNEGCFYAVAADAAEEAAMLENGFRAKVASGEKPAKSKKAK